MRFKIPMIFVAAVSMFFSDGEAALRKSFLPQTMTEHRPSARFSRTHKVMCGTCCMVCVVGFLYGFNIGQRLFEQQCMEPSLTHQDFLEADCAACEDWCRHVARESCAACCECSKDVALECHDEVCNCCTAYCEAFLCAVAPNHRH